MTSIHIAQASKRNNGKVQVFGNYEGADDRYTFGVRSFADAAQAEAYAAWMAGTHKADRIERD